VTSPEAPGTGLAGALLSEVAASLRAFSADGRPRRIDLRSLPLSSGERADLEARLGKGEVDIALLAAGESRIWETRYAGVWWLRHAGGDGSTLAETIEITSIPEIVVSHAQDIAAASERLAAELCVGDGAIARTSE
jgi:hydrogenase-1 operon protein HyaF